MLIICFICSVVASLESINLSSFNTNNVTNMSFMFDRCYSLISINLSLFNTNNVTNMCFMFSGCKSLKSIDLSSFNTNNVTNISVMFYRCKSLKIENIKIKKNEEKILNLIINKFKI